MSEKFAFCLFLVRIQGGIEDRLKVVEEEEDEALG
jgi:hypothetical protein